MIVTVGKAIKVRSVSPDVELERKCDSPGLVSVRTRDQSYDLPGNKEDALRFIQAYWRIVNEPIDYVESSYEKGEQVDVRELELE